jgi:hypothetical protein
MFATNPVSDGGNPYQIALDILNEIYMDKDQKYHEIVDLRRSLLKQSILLVQDSRNIVYELKIWVSSLMMLLQENLSWIDSN